VKTIIPRVRNLHEERSMPSMRLKEFNMHYEDHGIGLPLLLIHGFPLNRTMWQPQLDSLAEFARALAPDLRGFGLSDPLEGPLPWINWRDCRLLTTWASGPRWPWRLRWAGTWPFPLPPFPERVRPYPGATRPSIDTRRKANREKQVTCSGTASRCGLRAPQKCCRPRPTRQIATWSRRRELMETTSGGVVGADGDEGSPIPRRSCRPSINYLILHRRRPVDSVKEARGCMPPSAVLSWTSCPTPAIC
jgi:hypothetical protein